MREPYLFLFIWNGESHFKLVLVCGFQLAQLIKSLMVVKKSEVQFPLRPKTDWCLDLMIKSYH